MENSPSSSRNDRKSIERNRRHQMKALYSQLHSLIPHHTSTAWKVKIFYEHIETGKIAAIELFQTTSFSSVLKEVTSLPDRLHEATNYIKKLQINLENMKEKKESLLGIKNLNTSMNYGTNAALDSPGIEIHQNGSALHIILITGLDHQFMFNRIIGLLHEEGLEILNASFSILDDTTFHSIHCEVGGCAPSLDSARISERIRKCVQDNAQR